MNRIRTRNSVSFSESAPEALQKNYDEQIALLENIVGGSNTGNSSKQIRNMLSLEQLLLDNYHNGVTQGGSEKYQERRVVFLRTMVELGITEVYSSTESMPSLLYIANIITYYPTSILSIPGVIVYAIMLAERLSIDSKNNVSSAYMRYNKASIDAVLGLFYTGLLLLVAILPVFVYLSVKNGIGFLDYPVVNPTGQGVETSSLGRYMMKLAILIILCTLYSSAAMCLLSRFVKKVIIITVIQLASMMIVDTVIYTQLMRDNGAMALLPMTYFRYIDIIGSASPLFWDDSAFIGMEFRFGVVIILIWTVGFMSIAAEMTKHKPGIIKN